MSNFKDITNFIIGLQTDIHQSHKKVIQTLINLVIEIHQLQLFITLDREYFVISLVFLIFISKKTSKIGNQ